MKLEDSVGRRVKIKKSKWCELCGWHQKGVGKEGTILEVVHNPTWSFGAPSDYSFVVELSDGETVRAFYPNIEFID